MQISQYKGIRVLISMALLLAALLVSRSVPAQESQAVGEIIALVGQAEKKGTAEARFRPAQLRDKLYPRDQIRTLENSKAKLMFQDDSILILNEKSTLEIDKYLVNEPAQRRQVFLKALQGQIRFIVSKFFGKPVEPDFLLETHTAVLGIRGTDGVVETVNPDYIYLLEALAPLLVKNKSTGETADLMPMFFITSEIGRPMRLARITPAMLNRLKKTFQVGSESPPDNMSDPSLPPGVAGAAPYQVPSSQLLQQPPLPVFHGPVQPALPVFHGPKP